MQSQQPEKTVFVLKNYSPVIHKKNKKIPALGRPQPPVYSGQLCPHLIRGQATIYGCPNPLFSQKTARLSGRHFSRTIQPVLPLIESASSRLGTNHKRNLTPP